jgi:hypothetical protein
MASEAPGWRQGGGARRRASVRRRLYLLGAHVAAARRAPAAAGERMAANPAYEGPLAGVKVSADQGHIGSSWSKGHISSVKSFGCWKKDSTCLV